MASSTPNRGPELLAVNIAFMSAALLANSLRCYVRLTVVKAFGVDDWLMAFATLSFVTYCSFSIVGIHYGTGRHLSNLSTENIQRAMNYWWYCYLFYCISMIFSKVSIGYFLLRIAVKKVHAWIVYAAIFTSMAAGVAFFFVTVFQCKPISFFWDKAQPGMCVNIDVIISLAYLYSIFSIISDFTFAILPAFLVWNLQLKRRTRIALIPLLTMGCIASAAVVARVPYLANFRNPDFLWATLDIAIWSTVEQGLAITAGSLATLRPLFQIATHKLGLSTGLSKVRRPSNCGLQPPPSSQMLGGRRKPSRSELDMYNMSAMVEARGSKETMKKEADINVKSPSWYLATFNKAKRGSDCSKQAVLEKESRKSLRAQSSRGSNDQDGMHIMVEKSFTMKDEPRK